MLRGLWTLTWLEAKIFFREPLGVVANVAVPVALFLVLGRVLAGEIDPASASAANLRLITVKIPVFAAVLIALSAVVSIVAIISIYRESGVLKRLFATPLRPHTIFAAHVLVKLALTATTIILLVVAGRNFYPATVNLPLVSFIGASLFATTAILAVGFLISSVVPTARFAQPLASLVLYPMIGLSGLFVPIDELPAFWQLIARLLPLTYVVSLLEGIWSGNPWSAHSGDMLALVMVFFVSILIAASVFRWE